MQDYLQYANSGMVWMLCSITVIIMIVQVVLFRRAALKTADALKMPKATTDLAFRTGLFSAIGPAVGVFIVIVGVIGSIGAPMAWLRCSVIGSAGTELYGATVGAQMAGTSLGAPDYDLTAMALSWLSMALNGCGWMIFVGLFTPALDKLRTKMSGGDAAWVGVFSLACCIGMFGYLTQSNIIAGIGPATAAVGGAVSMAVMNTWVTKKFPKLSEFSLGIAMIVGIALAAAVA